jgi:hypothetical protein
MRRASECGGYIGPPSRFGPSKAALAQLAIEEGARAEPFVTLARQLFTEIPAGFYPFLIIAVLFAVDARGATPNELRRDLAALVPGVVDLELLAMLPPDAQGDAYRALPAQRRVHVAREWRVYRARARARLPVLPGPRGADQASRGRDDRSRGRGRAHPLTPGANLQRVCGPDRTRGRGRATPQEEPLSNIIERLNEKFGTQRTDADRLFVDQIFEDLAETESLQLEAGANRFADFAFEFDTTLQDAIAGRIDRNEKMGVQLLDNDELRQELLAARLPWVYARARVARQRVCPIGDLLGPDREDQYLEFKSTLRWDIKQQTKSPIPEDAVVKTVAGLCNSAHGGTLVIGVADDGNVFGLEEDYATFSKRGTRGDRDLLGQHLQNLVMHRLGHAAATLGCSQRALGDHHSAARAGGPRGLSDGQHP